MRLHRTVLLCTCLLLVTNLSFAAAPPTETAAEQQTRKDLKEELFKELSSADIFDANFDKQKEVDLTNTELKLAAAYLKQGDRKNAAIHGVLARRRMQRILGNPSDPKMVPFYSLLVQVYESSYDRDDPKAAPEFMKNAELYRAAIDKIKGL